MKFFSFNKRKDAVTRLIMMEERLHVLYNLYAVIFPNYASFWANLSYEETKHAESLRTFLKRSTEGSMVLLEDRLNVEPLDRFLKQLAGFIKTGKQQKRKGLTAPSEHETDFIQALTRAMSIEDTMLERDFYKVFDGDSLKIKRVFYQLAKSTREHAAKVRRLYDWYRPTMKEIPTGRFKKPQSKRMKKAPPQKPH